MALFIRQNESQTKLQERLTAELREKAKARSERDGNVPDGVDDSQFLKGTKTTTNLAWVWVLVAIFAIIATFAILVAGK